MFIVWFPVAFVVEPFAGMIFSAPVFVDVPLATEIEVVFSVATGVSSKDAGVTTGVAVSTGIAVVSTGIAVVSTGIAVVSTGIAEGSGVVVAGAEVLLGVLLEQPDAATIMATIDSKTT
jgi:hypothetical protein